VLDNLGAVSKALNRPKIYILKYLGYQLGASTQCTQKGGVEKHLIMGVFDRSRLKKIVSDFVENFVICSVCGNPETVLNVERKCVVLNCNACGGRSLVNDKSKLTKVIIGTTRLGRHLNYHLPH